jgi:hypothetical protein
MTMSVILTTPEFTRGELDILREATLRAANKATTSSVVHPSLRAELREVFDLVSDLDFTENGDVRYDDLIIEATPRQRSLLKHATVAYGIVLITVRSDVLDIVKKLEQAEVK